MALVVVGGAYYKMTGNGPSSCLPGARPQDHENLLTDGYEEQEDNKLELTPVGKARPADDLYHSAPGGV